jgi:phosphate transport system substrate-binding protein
MKNPFEAWCVVVGRDAIPPYNVTRKQLNSLVTWFLMSLLGLLAACGTPMLPPEPVRFTVAGSIAMTPLLTELAEAYQVHFPQVSIAVEGGGSRLGLARVKDGTVALGASSWLPTEDGAAVWSAPVAVDGIAVVVHPANPVTAMTLAELREVFSGRLWDWAELGGRGEVQVISREDGSGTRAAFDTRVMEGQRVTPTALIMPGSQAVADYVAAHPEAIGYVSMGYLSEEIKALAMEGVTPTPNTVADGTYHLARPLFLVASGEPHGAPRSFVDFVLGTQGQQIVGQGYGQVR